MARPLRPRERKFSGSDAVKDLLWLSQLKVVEVVCEQTSVWHKMQTGSRKTFESECEAYRYYVEFPDQSIAADAEAEAQQ